MNRAANMTRGNLLRFLYAHNPFYVISAMLVFYGLRQCFADGSLTGGWLMMGLLCSYTLLLAGAAWVIIRFGQVWDDARTILLVLVLMFLALSVSFDEIALKNPLAGAGFLLAAFAFAVLVSECVLWSLQMRLPAIYRVPYYLQLALMFVYPGVLAMINVSGLNDPVAMGVFLFPWLAAFCMLTLLPAAQAGRWGASSNGTPWRWPLYPWSLFAILTVSLALRSYWLTGAFDVVSGLHEQFRPYFLAPLLLAASAVLLEMAKTAGNRRLQHVVLLVPLGLLPLMFVGTDSLSRHDLLIQLLLAHFAPPPLLIVWALLAFYAVAWLRGFRFAEVGIAVAALASTCIGFDTINLATLSRPQMLPVDVLSAFLVVLGVVKGASWVTGTGCALGIGSMSLRFSGTWLMLHGAYVPIHAAVLAILIIGLLFDDRAARLLRRGALVAIPLLALLATVGYDWLFPSVPVWCHLQYVAALAALAFGYWYLAKTVWQLSSALLTVLAYAACVVKRVYLALEETVLARGLTWLAWGMLLLLIALLISLYKGGLLWQIWRGMQRLNDRLRAGAS